MNAAYRSEICYYAIGHPRENPKGTHLRYKERHGRP